MNNPKEPGGWGREIPGQPAGVKDRTFGSRAAFPRDVDDEFGRHARGTASRPARPVSADQPPRSKAH